MNPHPYAPRLLLSLGVSASLCALLHGEDEMPIYELTPVMVSAPRFSELDTLVASRVQLIDRLDIKDSGATDIVDLLSKEANLHFRSTSGNSALSEIAIGGFGENSGQRVLVLIDGQRVNTADLGQINWLSIPLALVDSIEVIKGGQSALYGNNAIGGVVKISTRRPTEELFTQAQASIGSFDAFNARFGLTGREGKLGFSAHAEHDETDGYRDNSWYEATGGGLKLDWVTSDWLNAYFSVCGVKSDYGLPGSITRAQVAANPEQTNNPLDSGEEDALYYRGGLGVCVGDLWTFAVDAGYTDREIFSDYVASFFSFEQEYEIISISPTLTFENDNASAVMGLDYYDETVDAGSAYSVANYSRETIAGFVSGQLSLNDAWLLSGSLRVETAENSGSVDGVALDELKEDQYAWSLGLIRFFDSNARAYGTVRRFYRYPATDEIVISFPSPSFNPDIDPEWGHEVELGGDIAWGELTLGGRIFYQWMNEEIIYDPTIGLYGANTNLDETERMGLDLSAGYAVSDSIDVRLEYTWVEAEIKRGTFDGSKVPLVPEHKLRAKLDYRPSDQMTWSVGATYTHDVYIGGDFMNAKDELNDYVLFDLSARYALTEYIDIFATVDNLFDEEYISTAFGVDALYPGIGRSAKMGLNYRF